MIKNYTEWSQNFKKSFIYVLMLCSCFFMLHLEYLLLSFVSYNYKDISEFFILSDKIYHILPYFINIIETLLFIIIFTGILSLFNSKEGLIIDKKLIIFTFLGWFTTGILNLFIISSNIEQFISTNNKLIKYGYTILCLKDNNCYNIYNNTDIQNKNKVLNKYYEFLKDKKLNSKESFK